MSDNTMPIRKPDDETIPCWAQDMRDELRSLNRAIRGENGDPGLVSKVSNLEKGYDTAQKIITGLAISLLALLVTLIVQHLTTP